MASERTRNLIVGVTLLVAGGVLMVGIFALGKFSAFTAGPPYLVHVATANADGLASGSKVDLSGVNIGTVKSVNLAPDARSVEIVLEVNNGANLPAGTKAVIGRLTIGTPFISLQPPETPQPGFVPRDGSAILTADSSDGGIIPRSVIDDLSILSTKLSLVSDDLHNLLQPRPISAVDAQAGNTATHPLANISTLVQRIDHLSQGLDRLVNDPQLQTSLRQVVSNVQIDSSELKDILQSVKETIAKSDTMIDKIGGAATQAASTLQTSQDRIVAVSEKLVDTLGSMEKIMNQISKGDGTAGRLVNDPRLYEGLVDVTTSLKSTLDELKVLIRKWKEEGVNLKL